MYVADSIYAFKARKNHNHGPNGVWVGIRAILVLCVVGIMNHKIGYLAAILDLSVRMKWVRMLDGIKNIKNIEEKNE